MTIIVTSQNKRNSGQHSCNVFFKLVVENLCHPADNLDLFGSDCFSKYERSRENLLCVKIFVRVFIIKEKNICESCCVKISVTVIDSQNAREGKNFWV